MKKFISLILMLAAVAALSAAAYADFTYWDNIITGEVVIRTTTPTEAEQVYLKPHKHVFGEWTVTKEATCEETGSQTRTCAKCGVKETAVIEKAEHKYGPWMRILEPTCTNYGVQEQVCKVCGYTNTEQLPMLPHTFRNWKVTTEATDHSAGIREATCSVCGIERSETFDPEGTLRYGHNGAAVRKMQSLLADQGFLKSAYVDGMFGSKTEQALIDFQSAIDIKADGVAWPQTLRLLEHDFEEWVIVDEGDYYELGTRERKCKDCSYVEREQFGYLLKEGSSGEAVRNLQKALVAKGYKIGIDGTYGTMTRRAVRSYQEDNGYTGDGVCWPGIYRELVDNK